MLLKRHYDPASLAAYQAERERLQAAGLSAEKIAAALQPLVASHISLRHSGTSERQNFSAPLIAEGLASGFIEIDGDALTLHCKPEPLRYAILRRPGYYCCHDGAAMPMSPAAYGDGAIAAVEAQAYLAAHGHKGKPSPDRANPAGYERSHQYECVLDPEQHQRFKAVPGALAPSMQHKEA